MENRFTFRDLIYVTILIVFVISVWVKMRQDDRQWEVLQQIGQKLDAQTRDLREINQKLKSGVAVNTGEQTPPTSDTNDAFTRLRKIKAENPDYALGDWLVDSFSASPATLTPNVPSADAYTTILGNKVLECLVTRDPETWEWRGLLAESWEMVDQSAAWKEYFAKRRAVPLTEEEIRKEVEFPDDDAGEVKQQAYISKRMFEGRRALDVGAEADCPPAMTCTFKLRKGVVFSDGEPFDADDVVFTAKWIQNPEVAVPRARSAFVEVKNVTRKSQYEVEFTFKRPYFEAFVVAGTIEILPEHFYGKYTPQEYNSATGLLMGSGPYRLPDPTNWSPGKPLELLRNERYWGEPGPFDKIIYKVIEKDPVQIQAFKNSEIDMYAANEPETAKVLLADKNVMSKAEYLEFLSIRTGYMFIAWNQQRNGQATWFADKDVRKAMTMLIDRQKLCDQVFQGKAVQTSGPFNELGEQDDPNISPWPYDPKAARELLKAKGFEDRDGDGLLEDPDGKPFRVRVSYPAPSDVYDRVFLFIKDNMARGGVALDLDPSGWPLMMKKLNNRDFDAIALNWTAGIETDVYQMFHSSQTADEADNFMLYRNYELDKLIDAARESLDEKNRMAVWKQVHRIVHEDQPYTFVFRRKSQFFYDKRVKNVYITKSGLNYVGYWIMPMEYYVPSALQKRGQ